VPGKTRKESFCRWKDLGNIRRGEGEGWTLRGNVWSGFGGVGAGREHVDGPLLCVPEPVLDVDGVGAATWR